MEEELRALVARLLPCHWGLAPQGSVRPFAVLTRVSGGLAYTTDQLSAPEATRVQADIYGQTYAETRVLARRVAAAISGARRGKIRAIFIDNDRDLPGADAAGNATVHRATLDLMVHHI